MASSVLLSPAGILSFMLSFIHPYDKTLLSLAEGSHCLLYPSSSPVPASSGKDLPAAVKGDRLSSSPKGVGGLQGNTYRKQMWENYGLGLEPRQHTSGIKPHS